MQLSLYMEHKKGLNFNSFVKSSHGNTTVLIDAVPIIGQQMLLLYKVHI